MRNILLFLCLGIFVSTFSVDLVKIQKLVIKIAKREQSSTVSDDTSVLIEEAKEYREAYNEIIDSMPESLKRGLLLDRIKGALKKLIIELLRRAIKQDATLESLLRIIVKSPEPAATDSPELQSYVDSCALLDTQAIWIEILKTDNFDRATHYLEIASHYESASTELISYLKKMVQDLFKKMILEAGCTASRRSDDEFQRFVKILEQEELENSTPEEQMCITALARYRALVGELTSAEKQDLFLEITAYYLQNNMPDIPDVLTSSPRVLPRGFQQRSLPREGAREARTARSALSLRDSDDDSLPGLAELYARTRMTPEENNRQTLELLKQIAQQNGISPHRSDLKYLVAHTISQRK